MSELEKAIASARRITVNRTARRIADPTRTAALRKSFKAEAFRRLDALQRLIIESIKTKNAFGLKTNQFVPSAEPEVLNEGQFQFLNDSQKQSAYESYTEQMIAAVLLFRRSDGSLFSNPFVEKGLKDGAKRASTEWRKAGGDLPEFQQLGPAALLDPVTDEGALAVTRTGTVVRGAATKLQNRLTFEFGSSLQANETPAQAAARVKGAIKIAKKEFDVIAETEVVRAFNVGNISRLKSLGVTSVRVLAEWKTAGDDRVCPACASMEGLQFEIDKMMDLIPLHPRCRCVALPLLNQAGSADKITAEAEELATNEAVIPELNLPADPAPIDPPKKMSRNSADLADYIRSVVVDEFYKNKERFIEDHKRGPRGFIGSKGSQGERGFKGNTGDRGKQGVRGFDGSRGLVGNTGPKGDRGPKGETGDIGGIGRRGKVGPRGMRGADGQKGRQGRIGKTPDHEFRANEDGTRQLRFQKQNGDFGDWITVNDEVQTPLGIEAYEWQGTSIRFKTNGSFGPWIPLGGGGSGGGGGLSTVETDNTISGDGSVSEPLRNYGIVNRVIDQNVVVGDGQVMINHNIVIEDGVTIDLEGDGEIFLI